MPNNYANAVKNVRDSIVFNDDSLQTFRSVTWRIIQLYSNKTNSEDFNNELAEQYMRLRDIEYILFQNSIWKNNENFYDL